MFAEPFQNTRDIEINSASMRWNSARRTLSFTLNSFYDNDRHNPFPSTITVTSHRTGKKVKFVYDTEAAEYNEFWDGELAEYIPNDFTCGVERLIVTPY